MNTTISEAGSNEEESCGNCGKHALMFESCRWSAWSFEGEGECLPGITQDGVCLRPSIPNLLGHTSGIAGRCQD